MRLTAIGTGNPPVRRGQGATSWLVELGNGDKFIFDIGGGSVPSLWSLKVSPGTLDKLFVTHLHFDHVGGIFTLWDAMGWGRNRPLHIYGGSGSTKELGLTSFVNNVRKAGAWHTKSKSGTIPMDSMTLVPHEFDSSKFSPKQPRTLIYEKNGVKIFAFPVDHILVGSSGYRLEWRGLSMAFTGDSIPTTFEAEQAKGVDVFIHELFVEASTMSKHGKMPLSLATKVIDHHTSAEQLGEIFSIAKPALGVASHLYVNDYTIDPAFKGIASTYSGPVAIAQDLTVINVTPNQIVTRIAKTDPLAWGGLRYLPILIISHDSHLSQRMEEHRNGLVTLV
ncbi:MAG: metal-dependent hydrolase [Nitrospirales bacterium]|nr:MAG: metal-dependent hydrolase [Nitrospirales bacterium]